MAANTRQDAPDRIRLDKWLWHARFCRSRAVARARILAGRIRVDGMRTTRPDRLVGAGNVLTLALGEAVRVVRLRATGTRRGPASEARGLYEDVRALAPTGAGTANDAGSSTGA